MADKTHSAGAVLFTTGVGQGTRPLALHTNYFGGRGVLEAIHHVVYAPDRSAALVIVEETCGKL